MMKRREELKARLEVIEEKRFFLAMNDRWDRSDYELDDKLFKEELSIKRELAEE